jgi:hypothetical protein
VAGGRVGDVAGFANAPLELTIGHRRAIDPEIADGYSEIGGLRAPCTKGRSPKANFPPFGTCRTFFKTSAI